MYGDVPGHNINCRDLRESALLRCFGRIIKHWFAADSSSRRAYALCACVCWDALAMLVCTRGVCPALPQLRQVTRFVHLNILGVIG
jgi:hypothetical protein